jgi:hypothetical protein
MSVHYPSDPSMLRKLSFTDLASQSAIRAANSTMAATAAVGTVDYSRRSSSSVNNRSSNADARRVEQLYEEMQQLDREHLERFKSQREKLQALVAVRRRCHHHHHSSAAAVDVTVAAVGEGGGGGPHFAMPRAREGGLARGVGGAVGYAAMRPWLWVEIKR